MQLPDISDTTVSNVVRLSEGARKTRVLYAGDMDFAKAQFASVAPQLQLVSAANVLTGAPAAPVAETFDVVVIDCGAPGVDARAVVDGIRMRGLDLPIVLALDPGGAENSATKVTAELRVDDYTVKLPGWLARLTSRLEFAIAHHRRRRSLEAVQAAAERLRTVVESAPVCLARIARDGTILAMNAAAMKMVSAETPEQVLGKSLLSFVESGGADSVRRFLDAVSAGQPGSLEFETSGSSGDARILDTRAVPLSTDAEGRASALLVLRDATERKRLEQSMLANAGANGDLPVEAANPHAEERDALRRQLEAALEDTRRIETERNALRGEVDEARARAAMVEHVRAACTAAEEQLTELQANRERIAVERDALANDLSNARLRHDAVLAEHVAERERQEGLLQSADVERARLASRCEALEALVQSMEASQAAEREAHRAAHAHVEAELRRLEQLDPLAAEREALMTSLSALRTQFDEMGAEQDAAEARHAADIREQRAATAAVEAQLRDADASRALLAGQRDELRVAVDVAHARGDQLQAALDDMRAGRAAQVSDGESVRRTLTEQIETLQTRVQAALAERDAIHDELGASIQRADARSQQLQAALDELRAGRDAQLTEHETARRELLGRIDELEARVHATLAERDALGHEMRRALGAADARNEQLQATLDDLRAGRDTQAAESDTVRREFLERIEELQVRVHAALAERDAVRHELHAALEAADARSEQLQAALDDVRAGRDTQAAEVDAIRRTLTDRVDELKTRLDAVIIDREALERALEDARAELTTRMHDATVERQSLQRRLEERDTEHALLCAQYAALQASRTRDDADTAPPTQPPAPAEASATTSVDLRDAQIAFREAFQLLSGELHTAVETTRAQQAALLRSQPAGYDLLEERLRHTEAECRRLTSERDERDATVRALQVEIEQHIALRREQRKELVRALQESDQTERRAAARVTECARLRQMLTEAQAALQRLSTWASNQSTRLAPTPVGGHRTVPSIEAPPARSPRRDEGPLSPPLEASWS